MKGVIVTHAVQKKKNSKFHSFLFEYVLFPFRSGVFGFISFLLVLITAKYLGFLIGSLDKFNMEMEDLTLSLLGFALVFLIKFLENYNKLHPQSNKNNI